MLTRSNMIIRNGAALNQQSIDLILQSVADSMADPVADPVAGPEPEIKTRQPLAEQAKRALPYAVAIAGAGAAAFFILSR